MWPSFMSPLTLKLVCVFLFLHLMCNWCSFVFLCVRELSGPLPATPSGLMIIRLKKTGWLSYGKNDASFFFTFMIMEHEDWS